MNRQGSGGQVWAFSFGQIYHTGWRQMSASFSTPTDWPNGHVFGNDDGELNQPLRLYGLALDGEPRTTLAGILYFDDLSSN